MAKRPISRQTRRLIGGKAGKRGARYEDYFAAFKLVAFTPRHLDQNRNMRMREQAGTPVDDLLVCATRDEYYQLKDNQQVSWGAGKRKLALEFLAQKRRCEKAGTRYRLVLVVSDPQRRNLLDQSMPPALKNVASVFHFPPVARPADLAQPGGLLDPVLRDIAAARVPGLSELQHIAVCFHAAWVNHVPDVDGFCVYRDALSFVRQLGAAKIRTAFVVPPDWLQAQAILAGITGFTYDVSRGWFDWEYPPTDRGLSPHPCDSPGFRRFTERVIADHPTSFDQLEVLLP